MPIPFIRRTETQATQASAASLSLHTHAPLILDLLMVSGISCLLFQVSHHSGAAQMDGPWRGWSWDSCWAVAPADDWDGLQQWWGCDNYSWDSENSFLLTANLFLLRSIAHWVLKCQNVAYRWVFFLPFWTRTSVLRSWHKLSYFVTMALGTLLQTRLYIVWHIFQSMNVLLSVLSENGGESNSVRQSVWIFTAAKEHS